MKVKTKKRCPKCRYEINYNRTNLKRYQTKNRRIKCRRCNHLLPKENSDEILKDLVEKRLSK